ncbi:Uncharacterised protein [BD1-7 clade bacterium]|uniref:Polysaccharide biosynthesis protein C-terminal domain-containing protein n=1 Tax=BD1-7 clade bacterium TaxID=2029982 RepID=A0A5S9P5E2_9GAMM|nr:Uncharacterised protein [BD1-7 clade bacterium]CAA0098533.1 Uncharacterised protein [BD1-7 clade bacterium]
MERKYTHSIASDPEHRRKIRRGLLHAILIASVGYLASVLFNLSLARLMPPGEYGSYKVAEAVINICGVVFVLGGAAGAMRFVPKMLYRQDHRAIWRYVRFYSIVSVLIAAVVILIHLLLLSLNLHFLDPMLVHPVFYAWLVVPFASISAVLGSILLAAHYLLKGYVPWKICNPILRLILINAFFMIYGTIDAVDAIWLNLAASATTTLYLLIEVFRLRLVKLTFQPTRIRTLRKWLNVSIPIMVAIALQKLVKQIDLYMLEIYGEEENVGYFAAAITIVNSVYLVQIVINGLVAPYMRKAILDGPSEIRSTNRRGLLQLLALTIPMGCFIGYFGDHLLMLFGDSYDIAYEALLILIPGYVITTLLILPMNWLQYSDHQKGVMVALTLAVATNIVLNLYWIPLYGMTGAALATTLSMTGVAVWLGLEMRRQLNVMPFF